jgi:hypothetical protein
LAALFRRRPEAADAAAALLIKNGPQKIVTNALGAADSLSAVAALSGIAQNATLPQICASMPSSRLCKCSTLWRRQCAFPATWSTNLTSQFDPPPT